MGVGSVSELAAIMETRVKLVVAGDAQLRSRVMCFRIDRQARLERRGAPALPVA